MVTKAVHAHRDRVVAIGCLALVDGVVCNAPATVQHARAGSMKDRGVNRAKGKKNSEWLILGLCGRHHFLEEGIDGSMGVKTWESRYGKQSDMIDKLCSIFGVDLWALAAEPEERKPTQRSKKMVERVGFV